jgi:hypothetical protein
MVRQIAPLFFTMDIPATVAYYINKFGFECLGTWRCGLRACASIAGEKPSTPEKPDALIT